MNLKHRSYQYSVVDILVNWSHKSKKKKKKSKDLYKLVIMSTIVVEI